MSDKCPVRKCTNKKENWHLVCLDHWQCVPKQKRDELRELYRSEEGSARHRDLCFEILRALNLTEVMR